MFATAFVPHSTLERLLSATCFPSQGGAPSSSPSRGALWCPPWTKVAIPCRSQCCWDGATQQGDPWQHKGTANPRAATSPAKSVLYDLLWSTPNRQLTGSRYNHMLILWIKAGEVTLWNNHSVIPTKTSGHDIWDPVKSELESSPLLTNSTYLSQVSPGVRNISTRIWKTVLKPA